MEGSNLDWIKLILDRSPAFVNEAMDGHNQTPPLHRAVWRNDRKVVDLLLESGADINLQVEAGHTPLMWAAKRNHMDMLVYLLERGADPSLANQQQMSFSALDYAIQFGNYSLALWLSTHHPLPT